jgi:hypothetical protein
MLTSGYPGHTNAHLLQVYSLYLKFLNYFLSILPESSGELIWKKSHPISRLIMKNIHIINDKIYEF